MSLSSAKLEKELKKGKSVVLGTKRYSEKNFSSGGNRTRDLEGTLNQVADIHLASEVGTVTIESERSLNN